MKKKGNVRGEEGNERWWKMGWRKVKEEVKEGEERDERK